MTISNINNPPSDGMSSPMGPMGPVDGESPFTGPIGGGSNGEPLTFDMDGLVEIFAGMLGLSDEQVAAFKESFPVGGKTGSSGDSSQPGESSSDGESIPMLGPLKELMDKQGLSMGGGEAGGQGLGQKKPQDGLAELKEGGDVGAQALFGEDSLVTFMTGLTNLGFDMASYFEAPFSELANTVGEAGAPKMEAPNANSVNNSMSSADVYGMIADVLGKLAVQSYRDKVLESGIANMAMKMKQDNSMLSNVMMQRQMEIGSAQRAKSERLEKHGKVMKGLSITLAVIMWAVIVVIIIVVTVVAIVAIAATLGTASPLVFAAWFLVMMALVGLGMLAIAASSAVTAAQIYMTATDAMAEGGMIDDLLEAMGIEATEFTRILMNMLIQFLLGLVTALVMAYIIVVMILIAAVAAILSVIMAIMMVVQIALAAVMLVIQTFVASGLLDYAVRELCMAMGMDEEDAMKASFWTQIVVMSVILVFTLVVSIGSMAAGGIGGGPVIAIRTLTEAVKEQIQTLVRAALLLVAAIQAIAQILQGAIQVVQGALGIASGVLHVEIAKLEKEKTEKEYQMELVEIMNSTLSQLIDISMKEMEDSTARAERTMETGNQIWAALSRAGTAINQKSMA